MITINPHDYGQRENYQLLSSVVVPRPIAFITTQSESGVINAAPFSFFNMLTSRPLLISVSIGRRNGDRVKHSAQNIISSEEFVVHIVDKSYLHEMNQTSAEYPSHVSEVEETNLSLVHSEKIKTPGIKEAKIRMECRLHQVVPIGTQNNISCDLYIGEVVMFHVAGDIYQNGAINLEKLKPISRLGGADYAELTESFTIERPKL